MNQVLTTNGYDLFEVVSAFQKEIRRCNEKNAMFWGIELYESGFAPYAWKRMMIMSTEDIGLAAPNAPVVINALNQQFQTLSSGNDKKKQERLPYTQAILYLVHCPKSRLTDWALNYHWDSHLFEKIPMPSYALDIHTRRGKAMGKTINDFFTEGSLVNNHKIFENEEFYAKECQRRWTDDVWNEKAKAEKQRREVIKNQRNKPQTLF